MDAAGSPCSVSWTVGLAERDLEEEEEDPLPPLLMDRHGRLLRGAEGSSALLFVAALSVLLLVGAARLVHSPRLMAFW